jgi:cell division protein FtsB
MYRILARGLMLLLGGVLVLVIILMSTALLQTYRQFETMKLRESELVKELETRQNELEHRQEYLRLVVEDPEFIERVVRDKLGFARQGETIFRFDQ